MNKNSTNLVEMERRFQSRYIHTGHNSFADRECDTWRHPLEGCTGYFIKCYDMSTAGDDAIFVPDMSYEEFCTKMFRGECGSDMYEDTYDLFNSHYSYGSELQHAMLRKYVCDLMPIHRSSKTDFIPAILVDSFMELEEYSTYQELFTEGEVNPLLYIKENKQAAEDMHYDKDGENPIIKFIDGVPYGRQSHICTWSYQIDNLPYAKMYQMEVNNIIGK